MLKYIFLVRFFFGGGGGDLRTYACHVRPCIFFEAADALGTTKLETLRRARADMLAPTGDILSIKGLDDLRWNDCDQRHG